MECRTDERPSSVYKYLPTAVAAIPLDNEMLSRWLKVSADERAATLTSFVYFFFLLGGYALLKPVRDAMGLAGGSDKLPAMMTVTVLVTLLASAGYASLLDRVPRWKVVPWIYIGLAINLLVFYALFAAETDHVWSARVFFVWVSVYNLFLTSIFWSLMADLWSVDQAKRLYGFIAAGGSAGSMAGPAVTALLVEKVGVPNLLFISALTLTFCGYCVWRLQRYRRTSNEPTSGEKPLKGSAWEGLWRSISSPYLLAITMSTVLYTFTATQLYLEQASIVEKSITERAARTAWFAELDLIANIAAISLQLLLTGPLLRYVGTIGGLLATPLVTAVGFACLMASPGLATLKLVQIARRSVHYAFERPARESLYNVLSPEDKYKSKNAIDTVVYRLSDALSGWGYKGFAAIGEGVSATVAIAASIVWGSLGMFLSRRQRVLGEKRKAEEA